MPDGQATDGGVAVSGAQPAGMGERLLRKGKQVFGAFVTGCSGSSFVDGLLGGMAAFVVGYLVVYATSLSGLTALHVNNGLVGLGIIVPGESVPPLWKLAGWLFYGGHSVSVDVATQSGVISRNFVTMAAHGLSQIPYYSFPPLLLAGIGFVVATRTTMPTVRDAVKAGASIVIGYYPLAMLGAYVTYESVTVDGVTSGLGPDPWMAAVYAGGVYPLVFGGLGGMLAYVNRHGDRMGVENDRRPRRHDADAMSDGRAPRPPTARVPDGEAIVGMGVQTLSDIEYVMELVDSCGGRIKQKELVRRTGWSEAKVSRVTSALAEDGYLEKLQIGRENVIKKLQDLGPRRGDTADAVPASPE